MSNTFLHHGSVCREDRHIAVDLPLVDAIAALHRDAVFPLDEDPRSSSRAVLLGMMVLRPANGAWNPELDGEPLFALIRSVSDWCHDVEGVGGSWPISAGNAFDAFRLALQYGTVDAVLAGSRTVVREGIDDPLRSARRAHVWQPYTPLSWPALRPVRDVLEPAIAETRRRWQEMGVLSERRYPAQIAITQSGAASGGDVLDARIFSGRHPDGSAIESYLLTSEAGADVLRRRARSRQRDIDSLLLVASPLDRPGEIDVARVPQLLKQKLDARLVEHDGGATSLAAFVTAGAVAQLNLTLMRARSVRDVLHDSDRIDNELRSRILDDWPSPARLFGDGTLPASWKPFYAVAEESGEAVAVSFDVRTN